MLEKINQKLNELKKYDEVLLNENNTYDYIAYYDEDEEKILNHITSKYKTYSLKNDMLIKIKNTDRAMLFSILKDALGTYLMLNNMDDDINDELDIEIDDNNDISYFYKDSDDNEITLFTITKKEDNDIDSKFCTMEIDEKFYQFILETYNNKDYPVFNIKDDSSWDDIIVYDDDFNILNLDQIKEKAKLELLRENSSVYSVREIRERIEDMLKNNQEIVEKVIKEAVENGDDDIDDILNNIADEINEYISIINITALLDSLKRLEKENKLTSI